MMTMMPPPPPPPADGGACTPQPGANACVRCINDMCCPSLQACGGMPACAEIARCLGRCAPSDRACEASCRSANASGTAAWDAYLACTTRSCQAACGGGPAPDAGADAGTCVSPASAGPCQRCTDQRCCAQTRACNANPQCPQLAACLLGCPTGAARPACVDGCFARFPQGAAPLNDYLACSSGSCAAECGSGGGGGAADASTGSLPEGGA
jgi:hypothetical protein